MSWTTDPGDSPAGDVEPAVRDEADVRRALCGRRHLGPTSSVDGPSSGGSRCRAVVDRRDRMPPRPTTPLSRPTAAEADGRDPPRPSNLRASLTSDCSPRTTRPGRPPRSDTRRDDRSPGRLHARRRRRRLAAVREPDAGLPGLVLDRQPRARRRRRAERARARTASRRRGAAGARMGAVGRAARRLPGRAGGAPRSRRGRGGGRRGR